MKQIFIGTIIAIFLIIGSSWRLSEAKGTETRNKIEVVTEEVTINAEKVNNYRLFMDRMAILEGNGDPKKTSPSGSYIGKFQFGKQAFKEVGYDVNIRKFKKNPNILPEHIQEKLFIKYCLANKKYLERDIKKYSGKTIKGVKITKAGMLAAAHLRGYIAVREFLQTKGRVNKKDGNGTSVKDYLSEFQHINDNELDLIEALNDMESKKV
jgi:hypothetical protein